MADIEVKMGDLKLAQNSDNLIALGIGSCLIITFYDSGLKIGVLAHAMLPCRKPGTWDHSAKYVDSAMDEMLRKIESFGGEKANLECKLVGGANMFSNITLDIGKENILSAKKKLKENGIKLVAESTGGSVGKSLGFNVATGIVDVKIRF